MLMMIIMRVVRAKILNLADFSEITGYFTAQDFGYFLHFLGFVECVGAWRGHSIVDTPGG